MDCKYAVRTFLSYFLSVLSSISVTLQVSSLTVYKFFFSLQLFYKLFLQDLFFKYSSISLPSRDILHSINYSTLRFFIINYSSVQLYQRVGIHQLQLSIIILHEITDDKLSYSQYCLQFFITNTVSTYHTVIFKLTHCQSTLQNTSIRQINRVTSTFSSRHEAAERTQEDFSRGTSSIQTTASTQMKRAAVTRELQ